MKAISLWPPWASFIMAGLKEIETRSWPTKYRGPIAIHQTRAFPFLTVDAILMRGDEFSDAYSQLADKHEDFPLGVVLGTALLVYCVEMDRHNIATIGPMETALGDYRPGRFMWMLQGVKKFAKQIPAKGKQGIWEWQAPVSPDPKRPESRP